MSVEVSSSRLRLLAMLSILPWTLLLLQCVIVLPRYAKLLIDLKQPISNADMRFIDLGQWMGLYPAAALIVAFIAIAVSVWQVHWAMTKALRRRTLVLVLVFGVPSLMFAFVWVGVIGMHRTLMEGLQN